MATKKKTRKRASGAKRNIIRWMWRLFFLFMFLLIVLFGLISVGAIGYLPPISELQNPIDKYASQIYSSDAKLLGTFSQSKENRIFVKYSELSPHLIHALVATEDERYYSHSGIDAYALARAVIKTGILQQKGGGGGSTISQQLAKLLWSPSASSKLARVVQKPIEWVIATNLERFYTKDEIINLYLNKYDFNYNAVGIQSAAQTYFDKVPHDLTIEESAMLVGMLKNSSLYNPVRRPELTKKRRDVVFVQMRKAGYLSAAQVDSLRKKPIRLQFKRVSHNEGGAPYFREHLRIMMTAKKPDRKKYAVWQEQQYREDSASWIHNPLYGWCHKNKKPNGSDYNIYTDGLKIYTTIDTRMQRYAEEAVSEHLGDYLQPRFDKEKKGRTYAPFSRAVRNKVDELMASAMKQTDRYRGLKRSGMSENEILKNFKNKKVEMKVFSWKKGEIDTTMTPWDSIRYHKSFLRAGFMALDARTGHVKAYVGGTDFHFFKYDMVALGKRQIGSTVKPYLYTLAMEEGMTPCDEVLHEAQTLTTATGKTWTPRNPGARAVGEMVPIKWGLQNSSNWVTAYLMKMFSPHAFARILESFGLQSRIDPVVSLALGICDASVYEMAGAYTSFANRGIRINPLIVTRIEDSYGNVVMNFRPEMHEIFSEQASFKMLDMLRAVIDGGTGVRMRFRYNIKGQMGGKTGTTQNNSDGWFMSFTPDLVAGCWVGGEDRSVHFDRMSLGQGASMALPVHGLFYQKVYADKGLKYKDNTQFDIPSKYADPCIGKEDSSSKLDEEIITEGAAGIDDLFD